MKKKAYIIPSVDVMDAEPQPLMESSITEVTGNSGIELGEGDTPSTADSRWLGAWEEE